jgi:hypothetical protein
MKKGNSLEIIKEILKNSYLIAQNLAAPDMIQALLSLNVHFILSFVKINPQHQE